MRRFLSKIVQSRSTLILGIIVILFLLITIYSSTWPQSKIGIALSYYNSISSTITAMLTVAYVLTTNRQLIAMRKQLQVMDHSINFQIQPLLVPNLDSVFLEHINAYRSPEENFSDIDFNYRFCCEFDVANGGNGAALNVSIYPYLNTEEHSFSSFEPAQAHYLSEKGSISSKIAFVMVDKEHDILRALLARKLVLRLEIYCKNIFGAGFHEEVTYHLYLGNIDEENLAVQWDDFLSRNIKDYDIDRQRYRALINFVPSDAEQIYNNVKLKIEQMFTKDLKIDHWIEPTSFNINLVDFNTAVSDARKQHLELVQNDNLLKHFFRQ